MNEKRTKSRSYSANAGSLAEPKPSTSADAQQRSNRRRNRGKSDPADWKSADPARIAAAITAITSHGYAVRFGYTRDGGAFAIGVIGDGEPFTEFIRPTEDIDLYLDGLVLDYGK